jgi:hypothetical protein
MAAVTAPTSGTLPHVNRALDAVLATSPLEMHEVVLATPPCHDPGPDPERGARYRTETLFLFRTPLLARAD